MTEPRIDGQALTIGQLASRFGLATNVLRHWEGEGLITPAKRVSGRRRYRNADIFRVALIIRGKQAGLSLRQIGEILNAADGQIRRDLLRRHQADLARRIREVEMSRAVIEGALGCPSPDFMECPHCHQTWSRWSQYRRESRADLSGR